MKRRAWSKNRWAHRKLRWYGPDAPPVRGEDVKALQRAFNKLPASVRGGDKVKLKVDGEFGRQTLARVRHAAKALGVGLHGPLAKPDGVTVYVQHLVRHPKQRTPVQVKRGRKFRAAHPIAPPKPHVSGNSVTGGSERERLAAAINAAVTDYYAGKSRRFYSQAGTWTVERGITGEKPGERSDCSQWGTSMYHSAGVGDPNGASFTGGWTGSLAAHCHEIRREQLQVGDPVIYFNGPNSHHVELWYGDGESTYEQLAKAGSPVRDRTGGHGSPPVDWGDIDMLAGARFFRAPELK